MKPSHIIVALIGLAFVVELLVDDKEGVLSNLQQSSKTMAAADAAPGPSAMPVPRTAATTRSHPWSIDEDSPASETDDLVEPDTPEAGASEIQPSSVLVTPVHSKAQLGSPEFPYVPLPKPQLSAAGARIDYPDVVER